MPSARNSESKKFFQACLCSMLWRGQQACKFPLDDSHMGTHTQTHTHTHTKHTITHTHTHTQNTHTHIANEQHVGTTSCLAGGAPPTSVCTVISTKGSTCYVVQVTFPLSILQTSFSGRRTQSASSIYTHQLLREG
jgi:hypothetical protein